MMSEHTDQLSWSPMRMFICKVASRCNLDCDYCYVYHHIDQSWKTQPARMSLETARQIGQRIGEHGRRHSLPSVELILHGGEALSVGLDHLDAICDNLSRGAEGVALQLGMQTNGALFDEATLEFCKRWNLRVAISMDGPRSANDRHRITHAGESTFSAVERALKLLSGSAGVGLWTGFLAVIDLKNDPLEVYSYLKSWSPPGIDFLQPLGHHDLLPPGKEGRNGSAPYAEWLIPIFQEWFNESPQRIRIRRFRDIIALLLGGQYASEEWGLQPVDFVVVESNGDIEAVDTLKVTYPGATKLGLNVYANSFDDVYSCQAVIERQNRWATLCDTCKSCSLVDVCGGGYFPHRYSGAQGFQNPSIYCDDIKKLILTVNDSVRDKLAGTRRFVSETLPCAHPSGSDLTEGAVM